ncbi:hypothetical protein H8959_004243 [Pygathrix nigripes]
MHRGSQAALSRGSGKLGESSVPELLERTIRIWREYDDFPFCLLPDTHGTGAGAAMTDAADGS